MIRVLANENKVILTDCDGVLVDWEGAFDSWMFRHGYNIVNLNHYDITTKYNISAEESTKLIMMFNESAWIRRLSPLRDAIKYIKKLHQEHGYVFHCITSLTDDEYSQHLRTKNLQELFGCTVFARYVYLDCGASKREILNEYSGSNCWWIEDKPENAKDGDTVGLNSIIMSHNYNVSHISDIPRVQNWKEIYNMIVGE